jgi:predicted lipoprotein with Yx(FWY)xxD motif
MRRLLARTILVAVVAVGAVAPTAPAMNDAPRAKIKVSATKKYGRILVDGSGRTLYLFTHDRRNRSRCYGACADAWPPFLTNGRPVAGKGTHRSRLGTTRRKDGSTQVTYRGRPLYYYVGERSAGQILCQDVFEFGGRWLIVAPSGKAIR